jgi:hypothetical protein
MKENLFKMTSEAKKVKNLDLKFSQKKNTGFSQMLKISKEKKTN